MGFTILELLIVIVVIATIALLTTVNLESYRKSSLVADTSRGIVTALETAKGKTIAGEGGLAYKVHFTSSTYQILDENGTLIQRTPIDAILEIVPPASDILFYKVTGKSNGGVITVRVKSSTPQKIVSVSTLGLISEP